MTSRYFGWKTRSNRYWQTTRNVIDAFYRFFTNEMIDLILHRTNAKIVNIGDNAPEELLYRGNFMKETTTTKIGAFIGLLIYNELYKVSTFKIARLERYGAPILSTTMSWNRFFSFVQAFRTTTKKLLLTDGNKTVSPLRGNSLNCPINNVRNT